MPVVRYAKALVAAPGTGSVLLCFLGVALAGAAFFSGRAHRAQTTAIQIRHSQGPAVIAAARQPDRNTALPSEPVHAAPVHGDFHRVSAPAPVRHVAVSPKTHLDQTIFVRPAPRDQLTFLSECAGDPVDTALKKKLRTIIEMAAPVVPFHYSIDLPLTMAAQFVLFSQPLSVSIRDGRYAMIADTDPLGRSDRRRGFLWVDLRQGIVLGGIFFYPSNGEPTPTLTVFSRQVDDAPSGLSKLPAAFAQDLSLWVAADQMPAVTTRYFINAFGEKTLLAHDENLCSPGQSASSCDEVRRSAAQIDEQAALFLEQTHHAPNATVRMIASSNGLGQAHAGDAAAVGSPIYTRRMDVNGQNITFQAR